MKKSVSEPSTKRRFVLSRRHQKGQVAIFVALIFQVLFVFFALLINVGLLVHQKINLQQSADLAAYYGASKQAEILNTIAHVNFQLKQAFKLLTWRYRILGTFGFTKTNDGVAGDVMNFPLFPEAGSPSFVYNGQNRKACTATAAYPDLANMTTTDIPFFCAGHSGFAGWASNESLCKVNCDILGGADRTINVLPTLPDVSPILGESIGTSLNSAINSANQNIANLCDRLNQIDAAAMARFLAGYENETMARTKTIEVLAKDLSLNPNDALDLDGNKIFDGSKKTLRNNLTEANAAQEANLTFEVKTGLASNDKCKFQDGLGDKPEFLKKIEFEIINYYLQTCTGSNNSNKNYRPRPLYDPSSATYLDAIFTGLDPSVKDILTSLLVDGNRHTIGYEKNPYCVEYYAVKTSSEPKIPFLPLTKVKLSATAIAKPFGGAIGPWYGKNWNKGDPRSDDGGGGVDSSMKLDFNSPRRLVNGGAGMGTLSKAMEFQPNYSLFVGDQEGLRNYDYIAAYHEALAVRDIANISEFNFYINKNSTAPPSAGPSVLQNDNPVNAKSWPALKNWDAITYGTMPDFRNYDSLADQGTGIRFLEISALAPNQFEVMHYSIDPDFYHNYYVRLYNNGYEKIAGAVGLSGQTDKNKLRADFGAVEPDATITTPSAPLDLKTFSVKDQILVKNIIFDKTPAVTAAGYPSKYLDVFKNIVSFQSSLLTGWTFTNYNNYVNSFPNQPVDDLTSPMSFGQCNNDWNSTSSASTTITDRANFGTPLNSSEGTNLPPTPGNCVTGGRTGYSVKLVSPKLIMDPQKLEDPIDPSFFSF